MSYIQKKELDASSSFRCCPKTTTAIHTYNLPHFSCMYKSFYDLLINNFNLFILSLCCVPSILLQILIGKVLLK